MDTGHTAWVLISAALVLFMTPGLAFFYSGMVRRKSVAATIMHSLTAMGVVSVVWVLWGYSLAFGPTMSGFVGGLDWLGLSGVTGEPHSGYGDGAIPHLVFAMFQGMFAIITVALITGAFAERMKFSAYVVFAILWVTIVYAPVAHWVWSLDADGNAIGWLGALGALDFAGGTVVHINSGFAALAAAWIVFGRRRGYGSEAMLPHNLPFVALGAGMLWFGWFGFNAGSALAADAVAANALVVTNTAAGAGMLGWVLAEYLHRGKAGIIAAASGVVAGLVAITPAAGFVGPVPAIIIGLGAGVICYASVQLLVKLRVDDSLAVWGVHGMGGLWGALATGVFAGVGVAAIIFEPEVSMGQQVFLQLVGIVATAIWTFVMTTLILLVLKATIGVRVSEEDEEVGLDVSQHGEAAYSL